MLFKLLTGRDEDVTRVKISTGFPVVFKRNKWGDKVADICGGENVAFMKQSSSFAEYKEPEEPVEPPSPAESIAGLAPSAESIGPVIGQAYFETLTGPPTPYDADTDETFVREWLKIRKDIFIPYVQKNLDRFNTANDEILNSAIRKWAKSTEEPWPGRVPGRSDA